MPLAEDQHQVGQLGPHRQHEAFGEAVRLRTTRWDLDHLDTRTGEHRVERVRELSGAVADEEPEPRDVFAELHDQVAGLLCGPRPVGMPGHAQDVQEAVTDLEREQDVEPPQRHRAVDVEEVNREHAGALRAQELPPRRVGPPRRRRWYPVALQDPADRRGADAMAELEQLALDPLVSPVRVLRRHPYDQRRDDWVDGWAPGAARVPPPRCPRQPRVGFQNPSPPIELRF